MLSFPAVPRGHSPGSCFLPANGMGGSVNPGLKEAGEKLLSSWNSIGIWGKHHSGFSWAQLHIPCQGSYA